MDIGALHFQNPEAFWLLLLIPVLVGWYIYREHRRKSTIKFPALSIAKRAVPSRRVKFRHIVPLLRLAALACFVVALARPQNAMEVEYTSTDLGSDPRLHGYGRLHVYPRYGQRCSLHQGEQPQPHERHEQGSWRYPSG